MKLACKFLYFVIMWCFFYKGMQKIGQRTTKKNFFFFKFLHFYHVNEKIYLIENRVEKIEKTDAILKFTALDVHHDHKSGSLRKIFVIFGSIFIDYTYPPCLYNPLILFEFIFSGFLTLNPKIILSRYLQYNIIKTGIFKRQCELNLAYLKRSTDVLPNVFHYTN